MSFNERILYLWLGDIVVVLMTNTAPLFVNPKEYGGKRTGSGILSL